MLKLSNLQRWQNRAFDVAEIDFWLDLLDDFGPQLLRFLIDETCATQIPEEDEILRAFRKQIMEHPLSNLKPKRGNVWILFAFRESLSNLPFPFRKDGILLPFEWRKGEDVTGHSSLLPENLKALADHVKEQLGDASSEYHLYPDSIFGDQVDFSMEGVGFSSGWGALISGLYLAMNPKAVLLEWPFSSIQYDFEKGEMDAVGHLEAKIKLCASFGAQEFAVAPNQYREAVTTLGLVRGKCPGDRKLGQLKIFPVKNSRDFMQLAANIAKCNQRNRQRLIRNLCLAHAAVLLFLALIAGLFCWDQNRIVRRYYVDMTDDGRGLLKGIGEITEEDVSHRYASLMFSYQGRTSLFGKRILRNVQNVNSAFLPFPTDLFSTEKISSEYQMRYNEQKEPIGITVCEEPGEITYSYADKNACLADITHAGQDNSPAAKTPLDFSRHEDTSDPVRRIQLLRNESGQIIGKRFKQGTSDLLAVNADGVCGENYEVDSLGRVLQTSFIDCNGHPVCNADGVSKIRYEYDNFRLSRIRFLDKDGKPKNVGKEEPYHCIEYTYDACGNAVTVSRLTGTDTVVIKKKYSYSSGNITRETILDGNGKVKSDTEFKYDDRGNPNLTRFLVSQEKKTYKMICRQWVVLPGQKRRVKTQVFLNEKEEPCPNEDGFAKLVYEYNAQGFCTREERYGSDGKRKGDANHVAIILYDYDARNRQIRFRQHDEQDNPVQNRDGFSEKKTVFSGDDKTVTEYYYDAKGNTVVLPEHGLSSIRTLLDDQKRPWKYMTFGTDGNLKLNLYGWAIKTVQYDKYGNIINEKYYGIDGNLIIAYPEKDVSAAEIRMERNSSGKILSLGIFGPDGKLLKQPSGRPSLIRYQYDYRNRCTEEAYFGYDEQPFLHKILVAAKPVDKPDPNPQSNLMRKGLGIRIEASYWGDSNTAKMERVYGKNGDYVEFKFTSFGKIEKESFFFSDGQLALKDGHASVHYTYNDKQQEICREFFAQDDKTLTLSRNGISGWTSVYDEHGNMIEIACFGRNRELRIAEGGMAIIRFSYNDRGQIIKRLFYDQNRKPTHNPSGAFGICARFDDQGRPVEQYQVDDKDKKIADPKTGVAVVRFEYREKGSEKIRWTRFFDANDVPCLSNEKIGGTVEHYDAKGNMTERWAVDTLGIPVAASSQLENPLNALKIIGNASLSSLGSIENVAGIRLKYDSRGNVVFMQFYDKNRKICPVIVPDGTGNTHVVKSLRRTVNVSGQIQEELYELCDPDDNAHYRRMVHDYFERMTKQIYLDINGKPLVSKKFGFSMHLIEFNKAGLPVYEAWFDDRDKLVNAPNETYAITRVKYDSNNRASEVRFFNRDDFPVVSKKDGCACGKIKYDAFGRMVEVTFLDEKGKLILAKCGYARGVITYHSAFGNKRTWKWYNEKNELIRTGTGD